MGWSLSGHSWQNDVEEIVSIIYLGAQQEELIVGEETLSVSAGGFED